MYKYLLFDLDGTLVNTGEGIIRSAQYGLAQCGIIESDMERLKQFVGPPLKETFLNVYGMDEETASRATKEFRIWYNQTGKFQCELYEGMIDLLRTLRSKGYVLVVATSKPTVFSRDILDHLGISEYFAEVVGSNLDNTRSKKAEIIRYVLDTFNIVDKTEVVMIGDKAQDLVGAKVCGVDAIGVSYGFGSVAELQTEINKTIVHSTKELLDYLEKNDNE